MGKTKTADPVEAEPVKVASTEVDRPLTAREIRKQEALSDTVKYAKRYHLGMMATVPLAITTVLSWFIGVWSEGDGGDWALTGFLFLLLTIVSAGLTAWAHDLWQRATRKFLSGGAPEPVQRGWQY